jgi:DNA-binding GntR family transcriptional regulator
MSASPPNDTRPPGRLGLTATTATRVAADLRRRILAGELQPGQRLKLDELAALCGVSHMPVREALRELEGEGVLEVLPHRGATIRGVDERFVRNFYDVRAAIEGILTRRCAERMDAAGLAALRSAASAFEAAAAGEQLEALIAANRRFHDTLNAAADNPEALRMLAQGRLLAEALRQRFGYGPLRTAVVVDEHARIVSAIAAHDAARAADLAQQHALTAGDDLLARMRAP